MTSGSAVVYTRRRVRDQIRALLASDSVRNFIWIFYIGFFAWGLWGTFWAYPIDLVVDPMGINVYDAWVWMPLGAMPTALLGLIMRHGGGPAANIHEPLLRRDFMGLWMQVGGHGCMAVVLAVYVGTGIYGADPHQPIISVFVFIPYLVSVLLLMAQCLYKIGLGRAEQAS